MAQDNRRSPRQNRDGRRAASSTASPRGNGTRTSRPARANDNGDFGRSTPRTGGKEYGGGGTPRSRVSWQDSDLQRVEGRHPVIEALNAGNRVKVLHLLKGGEGESFDTMQRLAVEQGVRVRWSTRAELDEMSEGRVHQGAIAEVTPKPLVDLVDILQLAKQRGEMPFILVLDGVEDPQNVGSLVRSAEAAGCHGLVMRSRRAASVSPALVKAAAGAWEHLAVAQVVNIARTLEELKKEGLWIVGADMDGDMVYHADMARPVALVIGSEGKGLSQLVQKCCDFLVRIPMHGQVSSLNAGVAGGALMFEIVRQRLSEGLKNS